MKIPLNEEVYLKSGLKLAEQGLFREALKMFNKCQSYEGKVNRVLMLMCCGEVFFACEGFFKLYSQYGLTHNVYSDVHDNLGLLSKNLDVLGLPKKLKKHSKKLASAKQGQLFWYLGADNDDDNESFFLELSKFCEDIDEEELDERNCFYDLSSDSYQVMLLRNESIEFNTGGKKANYYKKMLMKQKTDFLPTRLYQLREYILSDNDSEALKIALEIYNHPDMDDTDLLNVATFFCRMKQDQSLIKTVFERILKDNDSTLRTLDRCMQLASNFLKDHDLAGKFADTILKFDDVSTDYLKGCFVAYYNQNKTEKCKRVLISILSQVPEDLSTSASLEFLKSRRGKKGVLFLDNLNTRHTFVPTYVILAIINEWEKFQPESGDTSVSFERQIYWLKVLLYSMPQFCTYTDGYEKYEALLDTVFDIICAMKFSIDDHEFGDFARDYLCQFGADSIVASNLLAVLADISPQKFLLRVLNTIYFVEPEIFRRFPRNSKIRRVMCLLAVHTEVSTANINEFETQYKHLETHFADQFEQAKDIQIVYYLIAKVVSVKQAQKATMDSSEYDTLYKEICEIESKA